MHQPVSPRLKLSDEAWDDLGRECGFWEWIDGEKDDAGRNQFGEKEGLPRLYEALEANDWAASMSLPSSSSSSRSRSITRTHEQEPVSGQEAEAGLGGVIALGSEKPLLGLESDGEDEDKSEDEDRKEDESKALGKEAKIAAKEEAQVNDLEAMMNEMMAIRDLSADKPLEERRRLAAKAVKAMLRDCEI